MTIKLSAREANHLEAALTILDKYSRVYSAIVKDDTGICHDKAGTAANMIRDLLKEGE